ncbi:RluA family pseudouridine synthase [Archangium gephyra]|uniref:RluA family pseudouridine synthase n=1 Tax=Archangium gephyra TaxID=48 RepID=A0ABX9K1V4_9BACT|nr:RluA family pseudouridine synthase [Archangium gephyra]
MTYFEPQPAPAEVPERLTDPFAEGPPHPLARRAAEELKGFLRQGGLDLHALDAPGQGKMFGVLVVAAPDGRIGYLRGFSGMLDGRWRVDGFAPPLFDSIARDAFLPAGEAELRALGERHAELTEGAEPTALRASLAELTARHDAAMDGMRERHDANRGLRHDARQRLASREVSEEERQVALHSLAEESRADAAERQRLEVAHHQEREVLVSALRALDTERAGLEHLRAERSRQIWRRISESYVIPNARGESRTVGSLFAPEPPPGGAGDCAAPKLLAQAYRHGLRPLALAEFWWGASPLTGGRHAGAYYPACWSKCGGVLPYMLEGLSVELGSLPGAGPGPVEELRLLYEDAWLLVVDKPRGLLSLPGRHEPSRDSVLVRLQRRETKETGLQVVHALDPETSGLLLLARDPETHAALQRQFARREADRRFVAWLDGHVAGDQGVIELPLRPDREDRRRHLVDPLHGKRAVTGWRVAQRSGSRTRVSLWPHTWLPHQLRVHAAHPLGLGAPITGDRLYGGDDARLMLHAEAVTFIHPHTGERVELECHAPF